MAQLGKLLLAVHLQRQAVLFKSQDDGAGLDGGPGKALARQALHEVPG